MQSSCPGGTHAQVGEMPGKPEMRSQRVTVSVIEETGILKSFLSAVSNDHKSHGSQQHQVTLLGSVVEVQTRVPRAKSQMFSGLHSYLEASEETPFLPFPVSRGHPHSLAI